MHKIRVRLKSGREYAITCKSYNYTISNITGAIVEFSYKEGTGECPMYVNPADIECISEYFKEGDGDEEA